MILSTELPNPLPVDWAVHLLAWELETTSHRERVPTFHHKAPTLRKSKQQELGWEPVVWELVTTSDRERAPTCHHKASTPPRRSTPQAPELEPEPLVLELELLAWGLATTSHREKAPTPPLKNTPQAPAQHPPPTGAIFPTVQAQAQASTTP
jgi:hypothetical protein